MPLINGKIIGIAGYSGSGKSTLAKIVAERQSYSLIDVDSFAKEIMSGNIHIKKDLERIFGPGVVSDNLIDFKLLGEKAFKSKESILSLNSIVHPFLIKKLKQCIDEKSNNGIIIDAALISYWRVEEWFDSLIWVSLDRVKRLDRTIERVKEISYNELEKRFSIQESLFSEPVGRWHKIENSSDIENLYNRFMNLEEN